MQYIALNLIYITFNLKTSVIKAADWSDGAGLFQISWICPETPNSHDSAFAPAPQRGIVLWLTVATNHGIVAVM